MSIKRWLKEKIRNAAESQQLAYKQASLLLEVKKLAEMVMQIEKSFERHIAMHDSLSVELWQELDQYKALSGEFSVQIENLTQKVEQYQKDLQSNLDDRLEGLLAEEDRNLSELGGMLAIQTDQLSQLAQKIASLAKDLNLEKGQNKETAKEIQRLWSVATTGSRVQLMEYRSMKLFMFANDLIPDKTTEEYRNSAGQIDTYNGILNGCNVLPTLFQHYWKYGLDFAFLDVGCQYGHESILAGQYIKAKGHSNRIFCFDAGQASSLVPFNLMLNDLDTLVEFHRIAIGNDQKPLMMYYEPGYSEHNRSLNPQ